MTQQTHTPPQRQTAKIASIQQLQSGTYVVQDGWKPNYIQTHNPSRKISRVNVIGFIVDKPSPFHLLIDDGTGTINAIDFSQQPNTAKLAVGKPVLVIGRPRQTEQELFIAIEIATSAQLLTQPAWITYRKKELEALESDVADDDTTTFDDYKEDNSSPATVEDVSLEQTNITGDVVFDFVKEQDTGDGCAIDVVIEKFGQEADDVILTLISMGELYEAKPGKVKVLE